MRPRARVCVFDEDRFKFRNADRAVAGSLRIPPTCVHELFNIGNLPARRRADKFLAAVRERGCGRSLSTVTCVPGKHVGDKFSRKTPKRCGKEDEVNSVHVLEKINLKRDTNNLILHWVFSLHNLVSYWVVTLQQPDRILRFQFPTTRSHIGFSVSNNLISYWVVRF